jgi:PAS domain S-box-containing protein
MLPIAWNVTDTDGLIDHYNDAAAILWGERPKKRVTRLCGLLRVRWPDGRLMVYDESPLAVCIKELRPIGGHEIIVERPDGARIPVLNFVTPIMNRKGSVVGAINMMADVSAQRKSDIQAGQLAAIVTGSDDAILSITLDGIVTTWNPAATRIFEFTAEEMIGQSISRLVPQDLRNEAAHIFSQLARNEGVERYDTIRLTKAGRRVDVSVTVSPLCDSTGRLFGASKIVRDVTDRKRAEQTLRDATAEADRANQAKTDFLATMSHEIRTPLNSISGFVDLLATTTELTPVQRRYTDLVRTASAALLVIVNDILDFSKVEAGQLELEPRPFFMSRLVEDVMAIVTPSATAKGLNLICTVVPGTPETVMGDHGRLRQVLLNLLNNSVKFTAKGSIAFEVCKQTEAAHHDLIRFSVADTGVGIPFDLQHRLFKKFSQADSSVSREHGGTGLGLAICRRLVELMGGEIGLFSEPAKGTTVWFNAQLPETSPPIAEPRIESRSDRSDIKKPRILVVDDIDTNREIIQAHLQARYYHVECAGSGIDAIQMLSQHTYDLILMDIQMPIMDGVTATRRIRELPSPIKEIPIIAMSANVLPLQVRSFFDAGMNGHIGKPIEWEKFYDILPRWLPRIEELALCFRSDATDPKKDESAAFAGVVGSE